MDKKSSFINQVPTGLPCGQFVYCAEGDQNILYADENVVRLFGCESYEEFIDYIGNSFRNMVHPDDLDKAEKAINAQTLESGHRLFFGRGPGKTGAVRSDSVGGPG